MKAFNFGSQQFKDSVMSGGTKTKTQSPIPPQGARRHYDSGTHVTPDGKIYGEWFDKDAGKKMYYPHNEFHGSDGKLYIKKAKGLFYIEQLVIEAFHGKKPQNGQDWIINHKDGDITNNAATNLEWKLRSVVYPNTSQVTKDKKVKLSNGLVVYKTGEVYQGKTRLTVDFFIGDSDTDLFVPITPSVRYQYRDNWGNTRYSPGYMDSLMEEAGYIAGNKKHFTSPEILHKDNDYTNYASDNLEWVDRSDPRFDAYLKQRDKDIFEAGLKDNEESRWLAYWRIRGNQVPS